MLERSYDWTVIPTCFINYWSTGKCLVSQAMILEKGDSEASVGPLNAL